MIILKEITMLSDNMKECLALDISINEDEFPNTPATMMATPIIYMQMGKGEKVRTLAIYEDDTMIGVTQYKKYVDEIPFKIPCYRLHSVLLDNKYLGKGYEEKALRVLIDELQANRNPDVKKIFASYQKEDLERKNIFKNLGFKETDITWDEKDPTCKDIIAELNI
jgi:RimJ/RimL family protein N-acetyltransferase